MKKGNNDKKVLDEISIDEYNDNRAINDIDKRPLTKEELEINRKLQELLDKKKE